MKQEFEKQDELKRSAMRAVAALLQIPDAGLILHILILSFIYVYKPIILRAKNCWERAIPDELCINKPLTFLWSSVL